MARDASAARGPAAPGVAPGPAGEVLRVGGAGLVAAAALGAAAGAVLVRGLTGTARGRRVVDVAVCAAGRLPGPWRTTSAQVDPYQAWWDEQNERALTGRTGDGPLLVVLGDSAAQGVGASAPDRGWVGQVLGRLPERDGWPWRAVNLSRSGARTREVVDVQVPRLAEVTRRHDVALVVAVVGGNDATHTDAATWRDDADDLLAALPPGAVVSTVAQGWREAKVRPLNDHVRSSAAERGLRVADVWAHTGPPYRGRYADGFHPNDVGYAQWADAVLEALDS